MSGHRGAMAILPSRPELRPDLAELIADVLAPAIVERWDAEQAAQQGAPGLQSVRSKLQVVK